MVNKESLKNNKILAIDPSLNSSGYCILNNDDGSVIRLGRIVPGLKMLGSEKIGFIYKELRDIIIDEDPALIVCEDQFVKLNAQTLMKLSHVRGVIMLLSNIMDIPMVMYSPAEIKKCITGSGKSTKEYVYQILKVEYVNDPNTQLWLQSASLITQGKEKNDDVSDAIAIAITHHKTSTGRLV